MPVQIKRKAGRPPKTVDLDMVRKLASIGCTQEEIAYTLDVSVDTLSRCPDFAEVYKKGEVSGKQSLRHRQHQLAMEGSIPLLIFLGKCRLGQRETVVTEHTGEMTVNDGARERLISKLNSLTTTESDQKSDSRPN